MLEGKRKRPDEVGRSWSHQAPLKGPELQNRGGWGQGVGPRSIAKQGGLHFIMTEVRWERRWRILSRKMT